MIDFACRTLSLDDLVKCAFALTRTELGIFKFLVRHQGVAMTTEEIAEPLSLDTSTVQRAVKKLHDRGILRKQQQNLGKGGYVFVYTCVDKQHIKKIIEDNLEQFSKKVDAALQEW
jgi:predicted transcriptional regulator